MEELYLEKACKVNLNHSSAICENLANHTTIKIEIQKEVAGIQVVQNIVSERFFNVVGVCGQHFICIQAFNGALQSVPAIVVAFFAGPLSDRYARKPFILLSVGGYIILNAIFLINAFWFYELKVQLRHHHDHWSNHFFKSQAEFLLFECLQDITGGELLFVLGIQATIKMRGKLCVKLACIGIGGRYRWWGMANTKTVNSGCLHLHWIRRWLKNRGPHQTGVARSKTRLTFLSRLMVGSHSSPPTSSCILFLFFTLP